ncbi:MAG: Stp1/IreP family PP2C-type Ser/Thr phosphatase [Anaerolineae bacterium]|nr:Stp1/IreP family PP2C-type Ser/Thr phosphatase [Anaerolineae bacterium]
MTNRSMTEPAPDARKMAARTPGAPALELVPVKLTDVGRSRPHNEDYADFFVPDDPQLLAAKGSLFLVADGMGGHQAGEVASQGAVEMVSSEYYRDTTHDVPTSLVRAFRVANETLFTQAQTDPLKGGMGTTLVAAVILGAHVYVANVGDSRAYLIDEQGIHQITEDHSWVEEQVRVGLLTAEQARRHPQRNLVTRALGSKPAVEVDLFEGEIAAGQALLLCSDGLTGRVGDAEIIDTVRQHPPLDAARRLIAMANERGGNDNITVLLIYATDQGAAGALTGPMAGAAAMRPAGRAVAGRPVWPWALVAIVVVALAALGTALAAGWLPPLFGPTATPTMTATIEASPTSPVVEAVPSATETVSPTATLVPTMAVTLEITAKPAVPFFTDTPTPTHTATQTPTQTATPTVTPSSTPEPTTPPYPAPLLYTPTNGEIVRGTTTFTWAAVGKDLEPGDMYRILIWLTEEGDISNPVAFPITNTTTYDAPLDEWLEPGNQYTWLVVVVDEATLEILSPTEPTYTFFYEGPADGMSPLTKRDVWPRSLCRQHDLTTRA